MKEIMTIMIEDFVYQLFNGKGIKHSQPGFVKYYNDKFEVFVFDNRVMVMDKRQRTTVVYNNMHIAKAKLINVKS